MTSGVTKGRKHFIARRSGLFIGLLLLAPTLLGQNGDDAAALNREVERLYAAGKYSEAIPLAEHALVLTEKALGPDHQTIAASLNNLAGQYDSQGAYAKAEPLYQRALAIDEKVLGPDEPTSPLLLTTSASYTLCTPFVLR
jgi:tetratricopeptide (TPR) repeat protein